MPSIELIKGLINRPLKKWEREDIKELVDLCDEEIKEWEGVKSEAMKYLTK